MMENEAWRKSSVLIGQLGVGSMPYPNETGGGGDFHRDRASPGRAREVGDAADVWGRFVRDNEGRRGPA